MPVSNDGSEMSQYAGTKYGEILWMKENKKIAIVLVVFVGLFLIIGLGTVFGPTGWIAKIVYRFENKQHFEV